MRVSYRERSQKSSSSATYMSFVRDEYKKGYEIQSLPWQERGILSRPLWNTREHIIRIIPGYDPVTGEVFRQNIDCDNYSPDESDPMLHLSDTFMLASTVQYFGHSKSSFITDYAPGSEDDIEYGANTVINSFVRNVIFSCRDDAAGKKAKFGISNDARKWASKDGVLRFPRRSVLMQALTFKVNGEYSSNYGQDSAPLVDEDGFPLPLLAVVSVDGRSTISALMNALVDPLDPSKPLDALNNNKYGGLAEQEGVLLYLNNVYDNQNKCNMLKPSIQEPGSKGWTPTPYFLEDYQVKEFWVPWENLLHYMTAEEQCTYLASEFGADAVNYYIGTDPALRNVRIPDVVARAGYGQYAQFTDGVRSVRQTATVSESRAATPKLGLARPKVALSPSTQAMVKAEVNYTPKAAPSVPKPAMAPKPNNLGIPKGAGVDEEAVRATLSKIHSATGQNQAMQAMLDDDDLDAYMDDVDIYSEEE